MRDAGFSFCVTRYSTALTLAGLFLSEWKGNRKEDKKNDRDIY